MKKAIVCLIVLAAAGCSTGPKYGPHGYRAGYFPQYAPKRSSFTGPSVAPAYVAYDYGAQAPAVAIDVPGLIYAASPMQPAAAPYDPAMGGVVAQPGTIDSAVGFAKENPKTATAILAGALYGIYTLADGKIGGGGGGGSKSQTVKVQKVTVGGDYYNASGSGANSVPTDNHAVQYAPTESAAP